MELLTLNCRSNKIQISEDTIMNIPTLKTYWDCVNNNSFSDNKKDEYFLNYNVNDVNRFLDLVELNNFNIDNNDNIMKLICNFFCVNYKVVNYDEHNNESKIYSTYKAKRLYVMSNLFWNHYVIHCVCPQNTPKSHELYYSIRNFSKYLSEIDISHIPILRIKYLQGILNNNDVPNRNPKNIFGGFNNGENGITDYLHAIERYLSDEITEIIYNALQIYLTGKSENTKF